MYVVRRTFRGSTGVKTAGSAIEPADTKDFRYRLQQGHIVEITEHNFDKYNTLLKNRFGVKLEKKQPVEVKEPLETKKPTVVKATIK